MNSGQVLFGANFTGGVAFEAEEGVLAIHAGAVVNDLDERRATTLHMDLDMEGARVEAVFDQFADDGCRSFDHLTGSHLAGKSIGEDTDSRHGFVVEVELA